MLRCFNSSPEIQRGHERLFLSSSYTCQVAEQESGEATILRFMHVVSFGNTSPDILRRPSDKHLLFLGPLLVFARLILATT